MSFKAFAPVFSLLLAFGFSAHAQIDTSALNQAMAQFESADDSALESQMAQAPATLDEMMSPAELEPEMNPPAAFGAQFLRAKPSSTRYTDRLFILVNKAQKGTSPTAQTMLVYLDGQLIYSWLVSTGRERPEIAKSGRRYNSVTPTGDFRIQRRVRNYVSTTWQAPMPFAQFLVGGIAIHATTQSHYAALGSRDSGGCVRLHYTNAQTIWNLVDQVGAQNVKVRIVNQPY